MCKSYYSPRNKDNCRNKIWKLSYIATFFHTLWGDVLYSFIYVKELLYNYHLKWGNSYNYSLKYGKKG